MNAAFSRRRLLAAAGVSTAGALLSRHVAVGEPADSNADAPSHRQASASRIETGPAGMELTLVSVRPHMLRITVAAIGEAIDTYYDDGSLVPRGIAPERTSSRKRR